MKTPIYILNGEPRKIVEPEKPIDFPDQMRYESALIKAHGEGIGFEDLGKIKKLLWDEIKPSCRTTLNEYKPTDGLYHIELPEHTEVRQWRRLTDGFDWRDLEGVNVIEQSFNEYRNIIRFTEGEAKHPKPIGTESNRDWPEDYEQENGNYHNECCRCHLLFYGNKHRAVCKTCSEGEAKKGKQVQMNDPPAEVTSMFINGEEWIKSKDYQFALAAIRDAKAMLKSEPIKTDCKCEDRTGTTMIECCNICGKSVDPNWREPIKQAGQDAFKKQMEDSYASWLLYYADKINGLVEPSARLGYKHGYQDALSKQSESLAPLEDKQVEEGKEVWLVQGVDSYLIYGCFASEESARKFLSNNNKVYATKLLVSP